MTFPKIDINTLKIIKQEKTMLGSADSTCPTFMEIWREEVTKEPETSSFLSAIPCYTNICAVPLRIEGASARFFEGKCPNGQKFLIKTSGEKEPRILIEEVKILVRLMMLPRSLYIVQMCGIDIIRGGFIMKYNNKGDLFDFISVVEDKKLLVPISLKLMLIFKIIQGLVFIHSRNVIHCDLKTNNILLHGQNEVKITDFDLAITLEEEQDSIKANLRGTLRYMPIEMLQCFLDESDCEITKSVDVYSLGWLMWEIMYWGKIAHEDIFPIDDEENVDNIKRFCEHLHTQNEILSEKEEVMPGWLQALIRNSCNNNPQDRPVTNDLIKNFKEAIRENDYHLDEVVFPTC